MFTKFEYKSFRIITLGIFAVGIVAFNIVFTTDISAQVQNGEITSQKIISAHNKIRADYGLSALNANALLSISAQRKAEKMLELDCWDHYCPPNTPPWDFITDANYSYIQAGENLAEGFYEIDTVMSAWMNSPTHKENIVRSVYKDIGVGIVSGNFQGIENNVIIVVHFGNTQSSFNNSVLIETPQSGSTISSENVYVEGITTSNDTLQLFLNNEFSKAISPEEGLFFTNISISKSGDYELKIEDLNKTTSDSTNFSVELPLNTSGEIKLSSISPNTKNSVNIVFLTILFSFFIIDLLLLKFSTLDTNGEIRQNKHHSSYHLGLILVIIIIVATGGIAGSIGPQAMFTNI